VAILQKRQKETVANARKRKAEKPPNGFQTQTKRARNEKEEAATTPRRRGRPPKKKIVKKKEEEEEEEGEEGEEGEEEEEEEYEKPLRGRRKSTRNSLSSTNGVARKPSRIITVESSDDEQESEEEEESEEEDHSAKRTTRSSVGEVITTANPSRKVFGMIGYYPQRNKMPTSTPASSSSRPSSRRKFCFLLTSLSASDDAAVRKTLADLGGTCSSALTKSVTHVVTSVKSGDQPIARRTVKYLYGVMSHAWIVSVNWVLDSQKAGKWINEDKYEIRGDSICGVTDAPLRSRLSKGDLFSGHSFLLVDIKGEASEVSSFSLGDMTALIVRGGGEAEAVADEVKRRVCEFMRERKNRVVVYNATTPQTALALPQAENGGEKEEEERV
jgi:hypothetical protein